MTAATTRLTGWLRGFLPAPMAVGFPERLRGACGALIGLLATVLICGRASGLGIATPLLIPPMGASAVLLFALPASPLAQPWSLIGGNIVSALIGVTCAHWIGDPVLAAPVAGALAIGAMFALRCLHPPSAAVALMGVLGGPAVTAAGYHFVLVPVALNSTVLVLIAIVFNNLTRRPYPHAARMPGGNPHQTADTSPSSRMGVTAEDLNAVLRQYGQVLDIGQDDLEGLFRQAEAQAYRRRLGEITCASIMSRDVATVRYGTPLAEAWALLRRHGVRALPVLDPARRVIGMVSDLDFIAHADLDGYRGLRARFRRLIQPPDTDHLDRPEAAGQIMTAGVPTVSEDMHIASLVPLMADAGLRHVAVVDADRRLSGIISQADLVAALYRGGMPASGPGG